jgi:hypothetical protein
VGQRRKQHGFVAVWSLGAEQAWQAVKTHHQLGRTGGCGGFRSGCVR